MEHLAIWRRRNRPGVAAVCLVALVQLVGFTWVPVVHAAGLARGEATVEGTHSDDCSTVHVETRCTICALSQSVRPSGISRSGPVTGDVVEMPHGLPADGQIACDFLPSNPTRAPPAL